VLEFGAKVLGVLEEDLRSTVAYRQFELEVAEGSDAALLFKARVLSYAPATWRKHSSNIGTFLSFCAVRNIGFFACPAAALNEFQLQLAKDGASLQKIESCVAAISFVYRFFLMPNTTEDRTVSDIGRFVKKISRIPCNKKSAFGSAEVKLVWDYIDKEKGGIEALTLADLRTFVMAVFQHKTFCRFSDVKELKLEHLTYNLDFFRIWIPVSKTDQAGYGAPVYLTKPKYGGRDAHMLLCLYLQRMHFDQDSDMYLFPPIK